MQKIIVSRPAAILVCCCLLLGLTSSYTLQSNKPKFSEADQLLTKVYGKLEHINTLQYDYLVELHYFSENYNRSLEGTAFVEFTPSDPVIGFKYQLEDEAFKWVYNGTESFGLDKSKKTISVNPSPAVKDFTGITAFYNSLVTLRKALPAVIADKDMIKSVSDTSVAQQDFHLVKLTLNKRTIERLGGFAALSTDRKIVYELLIDKNTFLPVQVIQRNSINRDFARTVFSNVKTNPAQPSERSWYYSSYTNDYSMAHKKPLALLSEQALAPDWRLPLYGSNESIQLSQLKGKLVLLEFWNKNCGYCISAVPKLNAISARFQHQKLVVLGVNLHDREEDIANFYQLNKPAYKTVYQGAKVAEAYGIGQYPEVVLLDKGGRVLYAGGVDEQLIGKLVQKAL